MHLKTIDLVCGDCFGLTLRANVSPDYEDHSLPTYLVVAGPTQRVVVPEFLDQVTHKHESSVIHAKYLNPTLATTKFNTEMLPYPGTTGFAREYSLTFITPEDGRFPFYYEQGTKIEISSDGKQVLYAKSRVYNYKTDSSRTSVHTEETIYRVTEGEMRGSKLFVPYDKRSSDIKHGKLWDCNGKWSTGMQAFSERVHVEVRQFVSPSSYLKFMEPSWMHGYAQLPRELKALCFEASKQAIAQIPAYADNNIANIIEAASAVFSLLSSSVKIAWNGISSWGARQTLADLWMGYRYSYKTTDSDTQQAINAISRRAWYSYYRDTRVDGDATATINGVEAHVHLVAYCRKRTSDLLSAIRLRLWEYGLLPSKFTLWDLVPFSFVVDWVFNFGDGLKDEQDLAVISQGYTFDKSMYSVKYTVPTDLGQVSAYTRWESYPYFWSDYKLHIEGHKPLTTTQVKRAADTVALVQGFRRY